MMSVLVIPSSPHNRLLNCRPSSYAPSVVNSGIM
jgi:hypothetical protein